LLVAITLFRRLASRLTPRWLLDRTGSGGVRTRPLDGFCSGAAKSPASDAFWPSRGAVSAFPVVEET
jgi:hypothetical protein